MNYQHDAPSNESMPQTIETVYCSEVDILLRKRQTVGGTKFERFGIEYFGRI